LEEEYRRRNTGERIQKGEKKEERSLERVSDPVVS
jgi:hypothetical protein